MDLLAPTIGNSWKRFRRRYLRLWRTISYQGLRVFYHQNEIRAYDEDWDIHRELFATVGRFLKPGGGSSYWSKAVTAPLSKRSAR
jgi:hypothetical protein